MTASATALHVLRRAGFEEEGRLRQFLTTRDGPSDVLVFSVVRA